MDIVLELFYYMRDMKTGPWITPLLERYGRHPVFEVAATILAWLRHYGEGQPAPLELDRESRLDQVVVDVLGSGELSKVFQLKGYVIDFAPAVSDRDRQEIFTFVAAHHRPEDQLME